MLSNYKTAICSNNYKFQSSGLEDIFVSLALCFNVAFDIKPGIPDLNIELSNLISKIVI